MSTKPSHTKFLQLTPEVAEVVDEVNAAVKTLSKELLDPQSELSQSFGKDRTRVLEACINYAMFLQEFSLDVAKHYDSKDAFDIISHARGLLPAVAEACQTEGNEKTS